MNIPQEHQAVMPYLILKGAKKFVDFTETVFGAKVIHTTLRDDGKTVMHAEVQIEGSTIMFAESTDQYAQQTSNMFVYVSDADASYQKALDHGAVSVMPPSDKEYGRACGVKDPCGNTWWITGVK